MPDNELILAVGAEGGSLKVVRRRLAASKWEYSAQLRDQSLMLLDAADAAGEIRRDFGVPTLKAALKQLDRYPWPELHPIAVHPDARKEVLAAVKKRLKGRPPNDRGVTRWEKLCAPAPVRDCWPELTYRYVEHYFWEPQHLQRTEKSSAKAKASGESGAVAVRRRLRSHEVPLNYLLNVVLRLAPASVRQSCLSAFGLRLDEVLGVLKLKTPRDYVFVQPDVHLESEIARIFIELKVDAALTLAQVKKYVRLHGELAKNDGAPKQAYVLFLVTKESLVLADVKRAFAHREVGERFDTMAELQDSGVKFGSATWSTFAGALRRELARPRDAEAAEMLEGLVGDFIVDLELRGLVVKVAD